MGAVAEVQILLVECGRIIVFNMKEVVSATKSKKGFVNPKRAYKMI